MNIPKNIFQTWQTKDITDGFKMLIDSWKNNNPNYEYYLYDDINCREFIYEKFGNRVGKVYDTIRAGAFKADLWRCCILYEYGGLYADIDTICLNPIDEFLEDNIEFMTCIAHTDISEGQNNIFNSIIASVPKHPILLDTINRIVSNVENRYVPKNILALTGPNVMGQAVNKFLGRNEEDSLVDKEGIIDNIKLLKFRKEDEYVYDIRNSEKVLFQNKNGNKLIQLLYRIECSRFNHISWLNRGNEFND